MSTLAKCEESQDHCGISPGSTGKRKNRNLKRKNRHTFTLSDLSIILKQSGRHMALSRLVTLSISSYRNLDIVMIELIDLMSNYSY